MVGEWTVEQAALCEHKSVAGDRQILGKEETVQGRFPRASPDPKGMSGGVVPFPSFRLRAPRPSTPTVPVLPDPTSTEYLAPVRGDRTQWDVPSSLVAAQIRRGEGCAGEVGKYIRPRWGRPGRRDSGRCWI